jgi:hypothetical protein
MINYKKSTLTVCLFIWAVTGLYAQSGTVTSGGQSTGTGGAVSYTIGQVAYNLGAGTGGIITEGLQQPAEILIIITTTPGSRCGPGAITLQASATAGTIKWYAALSGGTALATGNSYTTTSLTATKTYYVSATYKGYTTSPRKPITASIYAVPSNPTAIAGARCGPGTVTLTATTSTGTIKWYDASTGGNLSGSGTSFTTPVLPYSKTYYAQGYNNGCFSPLRTAVLAKVKSVPVIVAKTPNSRCGTGTVVIGAKGSEGVVNWYATSTSTTVLRSGDSFTTPVISASTKYFVTAIDSSCSSTRDTVKATIKAVPTVATVTPALRCSPGTLILKATASAGTINWYAASTGGISLSGGTTYTTPLLSAPTSYYVDATNNGCTTAARSLVIAKVYSNPTITSTTPASRCGAGTVTLMAKSSAGKVNWYSSLTGSTLYKTDTVYTTTSLTASKTYYVEGDNNGCKSTPRIAVVATIKTRPTITSTTPASRIGPGTVTLAAAASAGTIKWYDTIVTGTYLATGTTYLTPTLSATKTYYVDATGNGCTTITRTGITATILPIIIHEINLTGLNDNSDNLEVKYYPNPASEILNLYIKGLQCNATLTINDLSGRAIITEQIQASESEINDQIDLSKLAKGIYYLTLKNEKVFRGGKVVKY